MRYGFCCNLDHSSRTTQVCTWCTEKDASNPNGHTEENCWRKIPDLSPCSMCNKTGHRENRCRLHPNGANSAIMEFILKTSAGKSTPKNDPNNCAWPPGNETIINQSPDRMDTNVGLAVYHVWKELIAADS
ncbi:hypothetical protein TWF481_008682 [Arthrobotrys musiformis]|uniref:CCHC-type domain-containing protein n=1 Tax=Arthrobotrys musiformis TaxID=47236 RepID=A0AAV9W9X3_9PEZI